MKRLRLVVHVLIAIVLAVLIGEARSRGEQAPPAAPEGTKAVDVAGSPRVKQALELMKVWLDAQRAYTQIPGVSGAVVYDQQVLWDGGFGYSDLARRAPATADTIYSICSISKLFTSIGVMQLRDAGRLRLDDPVAKHLDWFRIKQTAPEAGEATLAGLLTHSSGLPREADYPYWTGPDFTFPTHEQVVAQIAKQETLYPADTYFQYSNLGLTLAGEVVSAASGQPYADYVRQNILQPLGLKDTRPEMPEQERGRRLAVGYSAVTRAGTRTPLPFFSARGITPAAGFSSTADDLARFASWQFRLLAKGGTEVLRATTLREMHRVHFVDPDFETTYGLGFSVWRSDGKTFVGHGGSCPGYRTQVLLRDEDKVATVFMSNALGVNSQQFAQRMYDIVAPAIAAAAKGTEKPKAFDPALERYLGTYESSFGGEIAVVAWEDGLAVLSLPTADPVKSLVKLKKVGEHTFRRIRKDEKLGEAMVFEVGPDGRPTRFVWNSNYYPRMRPTT